SPRLLLSSSFILGVCCRTVTLETENSKRYLFLSCWYDKQALLNMLLFSLKMESALSVHDSREPRRAWHEADFRPCPSVTGFFESK
ncbi:mCG141998, partial [Mus musculus]